MRCLQKDTPTIFLQILGFGKYLFCATVATIHVLFDKAGHCFPPTKYNDWIIILISTIQLLVMHITTMWYGARNSNPI